MGGNAKTTHRVPVGTVVVVLRIDIGRIEVEVVGVIAIVRSRRPIVPVATAIVEIKTTVIAVTSRIDQYSDG